MLHKTWYQRKYKILFPPYSCYHCVMMMRSGEHKFCLLNKKLISEMEICNNRMSRSEYLHYSKVAKRERIKKQKSGSRRMKGHVKKCRASGLRLKNLDLESYYKDIDTSEDE